MDRRKSSEPKHLDRYPLHCVYFPWVRKPCKTTVTGTDDVLGLPTALHYASAGNVVSTLCSVDDTNVAALVGRFYKVLLAAGTRNQKLHSSSRDLEHPF